VRRGIVFTVVSLAMFFILITTPLAAQTNIVFEKEIKIRNFDCWGLAVYGDNAYVVTYYNNPIISKISLTTASILNNYSIEDSFEIMDLAYGDNSFWAIALTWSETGHELALIKFTTDFEIVSMTNISINPINSYLSGITYKDGYIWSILINDSINYLARIDMNGAIRIEYNLTDLLKISTNEYVVDVEFLSGDPIVLYDNGLLKNLEGEIILNATNYIDLNNSLDASYWFDALSLYNDKLVIKYNYRINSMSNKYLTGVESGTGFMIFSIQKESTSTGGVISEENAPAVATSSLASAAVAVGAGALVATAAAGAPATMTAAGSITSQSSGSTQVSTTGIEGTVGGPSLIGKLRSIALKIAKILMKLIRRKKKKEEGEEEFEKPSFLKVTIFLTFVGAIIGGFIGVSLSKPIMQLFSVLSSSISLPLGGFGATIGSILVYFYMKNIIVLKSIIKKISLFASAIGGYYGLVTSTLTLISLAGYLGLIAFLLLSSISIVIGIVVLGLTLQ